MKVCYDDRYEGGLITEYDMVNSFMSMGFTLLSMYTAPTNASTASASAFNGGEIFNTATPPGGGRSCDGW